MMKPSPVSEHLGRPPSRVPLCSDSGPLWGRGAGLKVEPLEHPPRPKPPLLAAVDHSAPGWPLFEVHGWRLAEGGRASRWPAKLGG